VVAGNADVAAAIAERTVVTHDIAFAAEALRGRPAHVALAVRGEIDFDHRIIRHDGAFVGRDGHGLHVGRLEKRPLQRIEQTLRGKQGCHVVWHVCRGQGGRQGQLQLGIVRRRFQRGDGGQDV